MDNVDSFKAILCSCQHSRSRIRSAAAQSAAAEESKNISPSLKYIYTHIYMHIKNLSYLILLKALLPGHPKDAYIEAICLCSFKWEKCKEVADASWYEEQADGVSLDVSLKGFPAG